MILRAFFLLLILMVCGTSSVHAQWDSSVEVLARASEVLYNIPHGLTHAFNMKENSGKVAKAQTRVEGGFYNVGERHYTMVYNSTTKFFKDNPEMVDSIPFDVERFQESTSWGPMQILGVNLRAMNCKKKYLSDITIAEHFDYFGQFLSGYIKRFHPLRKAVSMYNGPSAKASYANDVLKWMLKYSW